MKLFKKKKPPVQPRMIYEENGGASLNFFHKDTPIVVRPYQIPYQLWLYYYYRPEETLSTRFEREIQSFLCSGGIDRFNYDFMNNRIETICDKARSDLKREHVMKERSVKLVEVNKETSIKALDMRIQELEANIAIQEADLQNDD